MLPIVPLIILHVILLVLASTSFTVVTALGSDHFEWSYFQYTSQSGWGHPYQFPYPLAVVVTYLAAYSTGLIAYFLVWRNGSTIIGSAGIVLCVLGFASFAYELTHWFHEFYSNWIAHSSGLTLLLVILALFQTCRKQRTPLSATTH